MQKLNNNANSAIAVISFISFLIFVLGFLISNSFAGIGRDNCYTLGIPPLVYFLRNIFLIFVAAYLLRGFLFTSRVLQVSLGLVIGGGLYNSFERMFNYCVLDYYKFFSLFWFNIADLAIIIGVLTLFIKLGISKSMPK